MEHDTEDGPGGDTTGREEWPGGDAIDTKEEPVGHTTNTEGPAGGTQGDTYLALWTPTSASALFSQNIY